MVCGERWEARRAKNRPSCLRPSFRTNSLQAFLGNDFMRSHFSAFLLAPVLAGSLLLGGCGGSSLPQTSPVSGTVSYQGKPVEGATVIYSRGARKLSEGEIAIGK